MPVHPEDVYEDLEEADDEDMEDALGEDSDLSERRRRRNKARGRGYNKPRIEKSFVTQAQLQAASERIGKDIRTLDSSVKALETTTRRGKNDFNQSMQMMTLLPLLTKKTVAVNADVAGIPKDTKLVIDDGDLLTLMLPMMMMGGMGGGGSAQGQGGMDPMMMMMMVLVISEGNKTKTK